MAKSCGSWIYGFIKGVLRGETLRVANWFGFARESIGLVGTCSFLVLFPGSLLEVTIYFLWT